MSITTKRENVHEKCSSHLATPGGMTNSKLANGVLKQRYKRPLVSAANMSDGLAEKLFVHKTINKSKDADHVAEETAIWNAEAHSLLQRFGKPHKRCAAPASQLLGHKLSKIIIFF